MPQTTATEKHKKTPKCTKTAGGRSVRGHEGEVEGGGGCGRRKRRLREGEEEVEGGGRGG